MSPGQSIAHYRIVSKLGEGGMGAVYRAIDTKLNREVAIKVLPEAFAADAVRMARFQREAQTLAALNHPNIAAIHGVEQGALIMELVEGPDLKGPVAIETSIDYARQIAAGLEAAHERGIIHRDLKPANIKVTLEGIVKLLDFGLAKASEPGSVSASDADSPTVSLAMTEAGMILGTAAYMSPEQARGKPVDKRADIWAFGVVLYELLTGRTPFGGGETATDTIAAMITREPDWNALPSGTPPHVRRLIERCLRKDPKQRLRDIGDARLLLDEPEPEATPPDASARPPLPWIPVTSCAVLAVCTLALAVLWLRPKPSDPGPGVARFQIPLPPGTTLPGAGLNGTQWAPSPDGRNLAMVAADISTGKNALWIRPLGASSPSRLEKTDEAMFPFWSPDGQSIAFFADGKLKRVALSGGSVRTVCEVAPGAEGGGAWGQDGVILYAIRNGPLMRVKATGGIPQPATVLAKGERWHAWPQLLPDGRHVLYLSQYDDVANNAIYVQELDSAKRVRVLNTPSRAVWSPPGYLLFVRESTLFAQRMNLKAFQVEGEALEVAQDVGANDANGRSTFAVSENGVLVYRAGAVMPSAQLTWRGRDGKAIGTVGAPGRIVSPSLAPDSKSVAVLMGDFVAMDAWVLDLATGVPARMTRNGKAVNFYSPAWSPDSERLAITQARGGVAEVTLASGQVVELTKEPVSAEDWSPDGRSILCASIGLLSRRLSLLSVPDAGNLRTIVETPASTQYRFSPDGRYVVYVSTESGGQEIYVASFPSFAVKRKVSSGGGFFPVWAKGGKEIFYRSNDGWMTKAEIHTGVNIDSGLPERLFKFGGGAKVNNRFDVNADGTRFLVCEPVPGSAAEKLEITLVLNWAAEMKLP